MPIGLWILLVVGILIAFGVGQRVLDRMRLTDRQALVYVVFIFVGGIIPDIQLTTYWSVNIGGAIIPLILCIHLFIKAGTTKERVRAVAEPSCPVRRYISLDGSFRRSRKACTLNPPTFMALQRVSSPI